MGAQQEEDEANSVEQKTFCCLHFALELQYIWQVIFTIFPQISLISISWIHKHAHDCFHVLHSRYTHHRFLKTSVENSAEKQEYPL